MLNLDRMLMRLHVNMDSFSSYESSDHMVVNFFLHIIADSMLIF